MSTAVLDAPAAVSTKPAAQSAAHSAAHAASSGAQRATGAREFLTFRLGAEDYGMEILKVQEIRQYETVTRIANTPAYIKGVINLRGSIVPIIDLRLKFSVDKAEFDQFTVVIILNLPGRIVGVVVDSVSDVTTLDAGQIRPAPQFAATQEANHIIGLAAVEDRMLILLNIETLMSSAEMALFDKPPDGSDRTDS